MANRYMKMGSKSLIVRKTQIPNHKEVSFNNCQNGYYQEDFLKNNKCGQGCGQKRTLAHSW